MLDPDPGGSAHGERLACGVSDPRPPEQAAVSRVRPGGADARPQHDLDVPGASAEGGAIDDLSVAFEGALRAAGYLPMGGQIVDATLVSAPRQRLTRMEKEAAQAGEPAGADLAGAAGQGGPKRRISMPAGP